MKERPIIFSGPMVQAVLGGRKTMTRRVVKPQPIPGSTHPGFNKFDEAIFYPPERIRLSEELNDDGLRRCPFGVPGDRLWVREAFVQPEGERIFYRADWNERDQREMFCLAGDKFRSPIFMPRWASRITLERTAHARVERVEDITEEDARSEGFKDRAEFLAFFYKLYPEPCGLNPWVWVIEFKRVERSLP